jgi:hypothetical protein
MDKCLRSRGAATARGDDAEPAAQRNSLEIHVEQYVTDVEINSQNTEKGKDNDNVDGNSVENVQFSEQLQGMFKEFMAAMQEENAKVT